MRLTSLHSCEGLLRKGHSIFLPFITLLLPGFASATNPTQIENSKPGTTAWQLSNPAKDHEIEGYASLTSVNRGESIGLFVNTEDESYTIEIFRMGWYGGLGGRQLMDAVTRKGTVQEIPAPDADTGLIECKWTDPFESAVCWLSSSESESTIGLIP